MGYGGARHIFVGRTAAPAVYARRGVVAGCSLCTTIAKLILLTPMDELCLRHPVVSVDVFVDDVRLGAIAQADTVVRELIGASDTLEELLEDIGVPLAPEKTAVTA